MTNVPSLAQQLYALTDLVLWISFRSGTDMHSLRIHNRRATFLTFDEKPAHALYAATRRLFDHVGMNVAYKTVEPDAGEAATLLRALDIGWSVVFYRHTSADGMYVEVWVENRCIRTTFLAPGSPLVSAILGDLQCATPDES